MNPQPPVTTYFMSTIVSTIFLLSGYTEPTEWQYRANQLVADRRVADVKIIRLDGGNPFHSQRTSRRLQSLLTTQCFVVSNSG